jgi:FAD synthase
MSQHGKTTILSNGTNYVECHIHDFNKDIYGKTLKIKNIDYVDENDKYNDCLWAKQWI